MITTRERLKQAGGWVARVCVQTRTAKLAPVLLLPLLRAPLVAAAKPLHLHLVLALVLLQPLRLVAPSQPAQPLPLTPPPHPHPSGQTHHTEGLPQGDVARTTASVRVCGVGRRGRRCCHLRRAALVRPAGGGLRCSGSGNGGGQHEEGHVFVFCCEAGQRAFQQLLKAGRVVRSRRPPTTPRTTRTQPTQPTTNTPGTSSHPTWA